MFVSYHQMYYLHMENLVFDGWWGIVQKIPLTYREMYYT